MNADKPEEYTCEHFAIGKQSVVKAAMMERADDYKIDTDIQDFSFSFFISILYIYNIYIIYVIYKIHDLYDIYI